MGTTTETTMAVPKERLQHGDVFIDYDFEEVLFRYDLKSKRYFRKLYGEWKEHEVARENRLLKEALTFGDETDARTYFTGKPRIFGTPRIES